MDEPTASLDALAEASIYSQFDTLIHNRTAIYISHRLASTKFCDAIALIDNDGLREYGTHDELMALGGAYHDMFVIQGKYYSDRGGEYERFKEDITCSIACMEAKTFLLHLLCF
jgi:ABC-type transport system involved in cytochrome bd biosynthesis fused ATPase/permease subunit